MLRVGTLAQSDALRFSNLRRVAGAVLTPLTPVYRRHFHPGHLEFITTRSHGTAFVPSAFLITEQSLSRASVSARMLSWSSFRFYHLQAHSC